MSFCAMQGALVVGNKYMNAMVDNNKSKSGIENEVPWAATRWLRKMQSVLWLC